MLEPAYNKAKKSQDTWVFVNPKDGTRVGIILWPTEADQVAWESSGMVKLTNTIFAKMDTSPTAYYGELIASVYDDDEK